MRLGLTNTIAARGTPVGGDGLALDLQFAADKTLTARKGPTPVLTRGSTGTFVGSNGLIQTAASGAARFDHDPVTLASRGLLIEEGRTNLALYSGALVTNTGWIGIATSVVSGTGPDGNSSYQISEVMTNDLQSIANNGGTGSSSATSVVSGTTYTGSIFVKKVAGSVDWVQLTFGGAGFGTTTYANFNIGSGTVGNSAGLASGTSPRIENYGNGWYRLSISVTANATVLTNNVILAFTNNTNGTTRLPSYAGNTSNRVLASLGQFEAGSFATSYIPTTTSALARSADVCSITGANFTNLWNASEGTMYIEADPSRMPGTLGSNRMMACATSGSYATQTLGFGKRSGILRTDIYMNNGQFNAANSQNQFKAAAAIKSGDNAGAYAGSIVATSTTNIGTADRLVLYDVTGAAGGHPTCTIATLRYYKKRLPNAKLQALTA